MISQEDRVSCHQLTCQSRLKRRTSEFRLHLSWGPILGAALNWSEKWKYARSWGTRAVYCGFEASVWGGGPVRCMVPRVDGCRHCGWCRSRSSSGVPVTARLRQPPAGQQPSYLTTLHRHGGLTWRGRGRLPYCEKEQLVIV